MMRLRLFVPVLLGLSTAACNGPEIDSDTEIPEPPRGPELSWTPPTDALSASDSLLIEVGAEDPDGVGRVVTYYRTQETRTWQVAPDMTEGEGGLWTVELSADVIEAPGLEVYFKGEDDLGSVSYLPEDGTRNPFVIPVRRQGLALPYLQTFEEVPNDLLREADWTAEAVGFEGYEFEITTARGFESSRSVVHRRAPDSITGEIDDWLISPTLDLTSLPAAQVQWREYGLDVDLSDHSLWISTGSPDPADGEFQELALLDPPPEGAWGRSQVVDLTAYADEQAVTLAWVYRGIDADQWWVDDIHVRALGPDLRITDLAWTPDPLAPGDEGTLSLTVENRTTIDAVDVSFDVSAAEGATFDSPVAAGTIPGEGSVVVDVPVSIDPDFFDNAWIDLAIDATAGDDAWSFDERMLVGEATIASVTYTLEPAGEGDPEQLVRLTLGTGDPESPEVQLPLDQSVRTSGTYEVDLDITDYAPYLPPEPGDRRWWVRVESGPLGSIDRFAITYGGEELDSEDTGPFVGFAPSVFYLPAPPDPVVSSTTPRSVAPGETITWTLNLFNAGAATTGPTTVSLSTADPDVTLLDAGPVAIGDSTGWGGGTSATADFSLSVADSRRDSIPARMIATFSDDYESIDVPIDLAIPWPVLTVTGVRIDDWSEGDNDGLLDEGETVALDLDLTNRGDLTTFGAVSCELSIVGGTATATLGDTSGYFGVISAGTTENEDDFTLTVDSGSVGDDIDLELACTDRDQSYTVPFELVVGERPWIAIAPKRDAVGDNLRSYRFDFVDGIYRSDGETLEIILRSSIDHGGLTGLFIEAWGRSAGADYIYYNIVAAGRTGTVRGFRGGFTRLGDATVTEVDRKSVKIEVELDIMGLRLDAMDIGFAAGFCGGTAQYCDHYPDGWGAPYTGLSTSRWVTLSW